MIFLTRLLCVNKILHKFEVEYLKLFSKSFNSMFDNLTSGKKISLLALAAVTYFMLGAFICGIGEVYELAMLFSFIAVFGYLVAVLAGGIDFKAPRDLARAGAWLFAFLACVFMMLGSPVVTLIMFFFAMAGAGAVVALDFKDTQKPNIIYCVLAFCFLLLFIFWIIIASSPTSTIYMLSFLLPGLFLACAAGYKCYLLVTEKE